ncbi:response regulator [Ornithinicoccus hortensis]|uniref:response regulator n=1 Tax=Ornithinicoccus hortensis TaxID=82346 RepID=UPI00114DE194|nr:response regulator transcription factor [Ornithinicoccus hortensis]
MTVRVLIVDDHPVVRSGLRALLETDPGLEVVGEAGSGEQALALAPRLAPGVVLMDLRLGEGIDGVTATERLRAAADPPAVMILTTYDHDADIVRAVEAGAAGYLVKDAAPQVILDAVHAAARGETVLAPALVHRLMTRMRRPGPRITDRELEVLRLVAQGRANRAIAKELFISEATVKTHLAHAFDKLGVDNRTGAVAALREQGLLGP